MEAEPLHDDEREENQNMRATEALVEAEALLRLRPHGTLSTLSKRAEGWPFGSVTPYAVDGDGRPIIMIARIAEHCRNIDHDSRVSLLVREADADGDVQSRARLTLMGHAAKVPKEDLDDAWARFLARLPEAESYGRAHDFSLYRISVERLRYIGGFGKIFWLKKDHYLEHVRKDPVFVEQKPVVEHMNDDHRDALQAYCQAFKHVNPESVTMTSVDRWGMHVRCQNPDVTLRFDFDAAATPESLRGIVVKMAKEAKTQLATAES